MFLMQPRSALKYVTRTAGTPEAAPERQNSHGDAVDIQQQKASDLEL